MEKITPEDVQELKDITATHMRAGLASDWKAWTDTCSDDVILLPPGAGRIDGRRDATEWLEGFPNLREFEGAPSTVRGDGRMAFTTGRARALMDVDGQEVETWFQWLAVFEKQLDGSWKMVADMWNEEGEDGA